MFGDPCFDPKLKFSASELPLALDGTFVWIDKTWAAGQPVYQAVTTAITPD